MNENRKLLSDIFFGLYQGLLDELPKHQEYIDESLKFEETKKKIQEIFKGHEKEHELNRLLNEYCDNYLNVVSEEMYAIYEKGAEFGYSIAKKFEK